MPSSTAIKAGRAFVELFADDSKLVRGLRRAELRVKAFGRKMQVIGRQMFMLGAMAAAPLALATRIFVRFDDQMRAVQAVTGATGEEFDKLTEKAKELGRTTSFTAAQVAASMLELGRAGFSPKQIDAAIASVLNLARATGTELPEAANIAANTLRAFGLEADQMTRVADVMTATANSSAQTLTDLGQAMVYTAPIAAEYGMTIEETNKVLGALANFGIKGSMAGTTMKNILLRLADPAIRKQVEALGVSVTDSSGSLRNVSDILKEVGTAVDGMPNAEKLAIFNKLFGMRAIAGGAKLTATEFERLNEAIDNAAGTAAKTAATMDAGIGGAFRRLYSAVEGIAIAVGDSLASELSNMSDQLARVSGVITQWIAQNKEVVVTVLRVAIALMTVGASLVVLGILISSLGTILGAMAAVVSLVGTVLGLLATAITAIISPIGLAIAAVVALGGYLLYTAGVGSKALDWLGRQFAGLRNNAERAFEGIAAALASGDISLAMRILWLTLKMEWEKGTHWILEKWVAVKETLLAVWTEAVYGLARLFTKGWAALQTAWTEAVYTMSTIWTTFTGTVVDTWKAAEKSVAKGIGFIIAKMQGLDPVEMSATLDEMYGVQERQRDAEQADNLSSIQETRDARMGEIESEREGVLGILDEERENAHAQRASRYQADLAESERELIDTEKEWEAALSEAQAKREARGQGEFGPEGAEGADAILAEARAAMDAFTESGGLKRVATGAFSGVAASRMSGIGGMKTVEQNTADMAEGIRDLNRKADQGRLVFGGN
jgi:TP901 family phage tail tape measure protein